MDANILKAKQQKDNLGSDSGKSTLVQTGYIVSKLSKTLVKRLKHGQQLDKKILKKINLFINVYHHDNKSECVSKTQT